MIQYGFEAHKIPRSEISENFLGNIKKIRSTEMNLFMDGFEEEWTNLSYKKEIKSNPLSSEGIEKKIGEFIRTFGIEELTGKKLVSWLEEDGYKFDIEDIKKEIKNYLGVQDASNLISVHLPESPITVGDTCTTTEIKEIKIKKPISWDPLSTSEREKKLSEKGFDGFDAFRLSLLKWKELPKKVRVRIED